MTVSVQFENVSKKYNLGLTRTSIPSLLKQATSQLLGRGSDAGTDQPPPDNEFWALRDINFELKRGESMALVGSNGAGKTTTLKLLANITKPTSGTITTNGKLSALIELGAGFHPDLTGRENIFLNGTILGLKRSEVEARFDEIVAFSELERFIDTPVKRYSSGMTVRLGFAVASCIEPEVLLVDEVLAVGDAAFQQKCMQRIRGLVDNGTSIIFVSHNLYLVQAICDRALYVEHGQVKYDGTTKEVIEMYEQDLHEARTQKFLAAKASAAEDGEEDDLAMDVDEANAGVDITGVEVWGADGPVDGPLPSHQSAQVRVSYDAFRSVGRVHMSIFIKRADGLTCSMIRTKLDDFQLDVELGHGTITVEVNPLQLITGTYYAEAWFLNESDSMVLTPKSGRSDWFSVQGAAMTYDDNSGVYEPIAQWTHAPDVEMSADGAVAEGVADEVIDAHSGAKEAKATDLVNSAP